MRQGVTLAVLLVVICAAPFAQAAAKEWSALDHFVGLWQVERISAENPAGVNGSMNVTKAAYDGVAIGGYFHNGVPTQVKIETGGATAGTFTLQSAHTAAGHSDDEEAGDFEDDVPQAGVVLSFAFAFERHNGVLLSTGKYTGPQKQTGTYHYSIPRDDCFILTLTPAGSEEAITYIGFKTIDRAQPTFLQKFGPSILIFAVMMGSKLLTRKMVPQPQQGAPAQASAQAPAQRKTQ
eukprot:TRINITY_DN7667_c0_g1_i1.p1 TRINITY_DN7667_c0_g1~~TRINITY_DN7667_c0_g1_i1.p1  ORF type:complete len:236 (-),score=49.84 TRINITY_DN7667_c0_g1_i1:105-812(-)